MKYIESDSNQSPYYTHEDAHIVKVNVSSIAEVCDTNSSTALYILKRIISALIDNCRKEIKLNLRIGSLRFTKGQMSFQPYGSQSRCFSSDKPIEILNSPLALNATFNVIPRSRKTNSSANSTIRVPKTSMGRDRQKNLINMSNPNPQVGVHQYPRNNRYVMGFHKKTRKGAFKHPKHSECNTRREKGIPFPFLASFLGMSDYYKPGKRLVIENRMTSVDVHEAQLRQINQKRAEINNYRTLDQGEDKKYLQEFLNTVKQQDHSKKNLYEKMTQEFKGFNDKQVASNEVWKQLQNTHKKKEKYNFFPFTHGDKIEKDRITINK